MAALCYVGRNWKHWMLDPQKEVAEAARLSIAPPTWAAMMQWPCLLPQWRSGSSYRTSIVPSFCLIDLYC